MKQLPFEDRTDSVPEKLRLLEAAFAAGNLDLAMSLSRAAKETLVFEQQLHGKLTPPAIPADHFVVGRRVCPKPWAGWARGWKFCKRSTCSKPSASSVSASRSIWRSPFEMIRRPIWAAKCAWPASKPASTLAPGSSLPGLRRDSTRGRTHVASSCFWPTWPRTRQATYLVFYGNPLAERPEYRDRSAHRAARDTASTSRTIISRRRLSRQMGQLERLIYKRQHGLELYAGGKGHGEPPGIDWAHDYVDADHFQKLRMRNWPRCPNYEVVRGPLCVRVRRWGFPYSPVHPVFTPSRVHMDQTYVFYAGLPYFFKEGRIDVIKDVAIEAMRDDEWVFSGYSFTDTVWFDQQGKLHEGSVPAESAENLWGVGFYNRTSRDAFIALWLEHAAKGFDGLAHGGVPHVALRRPRSALEPLPGQRDAQLKAGTSIRQRNAYLVLPLRRTGTPRRKSSNCGTNS